nr:MAG TPA: hypothetical protein [Caudoviricetes sp.]
MPVFVIFFTCFNPLKLLTSILEVEVTRILSISKFFFFGFVN